MSKFIQCNRCGLSLPQYLLKPVIINGRKVILCDQCLKIISENAPKEFERKNQ